MADDPKTVWILGSGFSKGLGGPLLYELLTEKARLETNDQYPSAPNRNAVYHLYAKYGPSGAKYWAHAEDFLEFVDAAIEEPSSTRRQFLERLVNGLGLPDGMLVENFRKLAILAVSLECSTFVDRGFVDSETWEPYVGWARERGPNDTVITFNYDQVLEKLGTAEGVNLIGARTVVRPGTKDEIKGRCQIYKLHGSTTWGIDKDGGFGPFDTCDFVSLAGAPGNVYRNLIATPGATKRGHCEGLLKPLWVKAMQKISEADVIVFMGYRFPPSDSHSRKMLMGAIRANRSLRLRIHTVLGPEIHSDATVRLISMLKHVLEGEDRVPFDNGTIHLDGEYEIVPQPLFVEDFLSVVSEKALYGGLAKRV